MFALIIIIKQKFIFIQMNKHLFYSRRDNYYKEQIFNFIFLKKIIISTSVLVDKTLITIQKKRKIMQQS